MNNSNHIQKTKVFGLFITLSLLTFFIIMPTFASANIRVKINPDCKTNCTSTGNVSVKSPTSTYPSPLYVYDYYNTPNYPSYNNQYSPLGVSCYSTPSSGNVGDTISWRTSTYGGNGNYYITWSGSEGLSGYGSSIIKTYYSSGSKYASVTVTSNGQTITQNCNNVEIYGYDNNYYNTPNYPTYNYPYPYNYNYSYNYNSPLSVTCSANLTFAPIETNVAWTAYITGGNGYYTYNWSGTDYLYGSGNSINVIYHSGGPKTASVTVYSGNQTITRICSNSVLIGVPNQNYGNTYSNYTPPPVPVVKYVNTTKVESTDKNTTIKKDETKTDQNNLKATSLFSLQNVPWGWVLVLVILVLLTIVFYLIFNRNKI